MNAPRVTAVLLAAGLVGTLSSPVLAVNPATKLTRGIVNTTTGWLEIPHQMHERKGDGTTVWWTIHGFLYGTIMGITRTLTGVYDIATFPIGPYDGPLLQPDTLIDPNPSSKKRAPRPPEIRY